MNKINNDHQSLHGNIPFSWENRPGVRKDNLAGELSKERWTMEVNDNVNLSVVQEGKSKPSLPPPPCENSNNKAISNDIGLPLPPCVFQPHLRSCSSRRSKDDDPFLLAYKECTKSHNKKSSTFMKKNSFGGSCKNSCSVRDDSIVRVSHIPMSNSSDVKKFKGVKHQG